MTLLLALQGLVPYRLAHALQEALVEARVEGSIPDTIVLLTHPETITLGRQQGSAQSVLHADGVDVVEVERGGNATWHGPGQLVAYPIVQLEGVQRDLKRALSLLEDAVIAVLNDLGLQGQAGRDPRNTGVWIEGHKVCSIGIACRHWVLWHGIALNVDADLSGFARIRPCGFDARVMTKLADHLDPCPPLSSLVLPVGRAIATRFGAERCVHVRESLSEPPQIPALISRLQALAVNGCAP